MLSRLAEIAARFASAPMERLDESIQETQRLLVAMLGIDRSTLWQFVEDRAGLVLTHCWQKPEFPPVPEYYNAALNLPWCHAKMTSGELFHFSEMEELPAEAARDVETFRIHGPKSNVTIPLMAEGEVFGALAFGAIETPRRWTNEEITGLQLVAGIIGNVLGRHRAERRAEQLRAELARASRASMLGELAASLAHELNQPLTAILGNAQAARRFIASGTMDPQELLQILDDIINDDKRASSLIHNLRMLMDGASDPPGTCCLNDLLAEVCDFMRTGLTKDRVLLERHYGAPVILVRVVKAEIQQVVANLITNATQAMCDTPTGQRIIRLETAVNDSHATVRVRDRGCGFPAQRADQLFEPFHSTKPRGLGMGLAICRRIIAAHGGTIRATNHDCGGAEFSFTLPLRG